MDNKLRCCDLVRPRTADFAPKGDALDRTTVRQRKTSRPVKIKFTEQTRRSVDDLLWVRQVDRQPYIFEGRASGDHLLTRQHARLLDEPLTAIELDPSNYSTRSLRRTKATLIYKRTENLCAVQLLLGRAKIGSMVRYLGVKVDDAHSIAEQVDI